MRQAPGDYEPPDIRMMKPTKSMPSKSKNIKSQVSYAQMKSGVIKPKNQL